jgi:large subunit ribosomal protein L10
MSTPQKEAVVAELTEKFKNASALYLTNFQGMDSFQTMKLRKEFANAKIEYKVVKNTLATIALKNAGIKGLDKHFKGVTGVVIAAGDPTNAARVISKFNKETDKDKELKLKACLFEGTVIGPDRVDDLAKLPSRKELLSTFLSVLQAPMTKLVRTLAAPLQNTQNVLSNLKDAKNA